MAASGKRWSSPKVCRIHLPWNVLQLGDFATYTVIVSTIIQTVRETNRFLDYRNQQGVRWNNRLNLLFGLGLVQGKPSFLLYDFRSIAEVDTSILFKIWFPLLYSQQQLCGVVLKSANLPNLNVRFTKDGAKMSYNLQKATMTIGKPSVVSGQWRTRAK